MKKLLLMAAVAVFALGASAQTIFTKGSFSEALAEAGKAKKMLFVDVYTTWCGPCKFMTAKIFPNKEVGNLLNDKFVSLALDAEKDGDGKSVAKKYKVTGYPTMLILNAKGEEITRIVGSDPTPKEFIDRVKSTLTKIKKK